MQKLIVLNYTEIFNIVKEKLFTSEDQSAVDLNADIESINTNVFQKYVNNEEIDIECIEIGFNKSLEEVKDKYSGKIENLELKDGIDPYHSVGYIEMCDLSELVGK